MPNTVSATVIAAAEELIGAEAGPLVNELIAGVSALASKFVSALPVGVQGEAGIGANLLLSVAQIAAQAELHAVLNHNPAVAAGAAAAAAAPVATAVPVTPVVEAAPTGSASAPAGVVPFPGGGANEGA